jgi:hypothetical protein
MQSHFTTVERGAIGTVTSIGSAAVSMVSQLEVYLRIAGLCVGLAGRRCHTTFGLPRPSQKTKGEQITMRNWKTSLLGALTIIASLSTAGREFLANGSVPDLGLIAASLAAGWGLLMAKDNNARL